MELPHHKTSIISKSYSVPWCHHIIVESCHSALFSFISSYCYADSLPHPVTLQTAYADSRHSPDIRPNCGLSLTVAPAKLFKVRLRPLILTVKATCILTLLRSICFCLMRCTGSLSLFFSDISRTVVYDFANVWLTSFTSEYIALFGYLLYHVTYRFIFYTVLAMFPY